MCMCVYTLEKQCMRKYVNIAKYQNGNLYKEYIDVYYSFNFRV